MRASFLDVSMIREFGKVNVSMYGRALDGSSGNGVYANVTLTPRKRDVDLCCRGMPVVQHYSKIIEGLRRQESEVAYKMACGSNLASQILDRNLRFGLNERPLRNGVG
jgi:hypothetical protein